MYVDSAIARKAALIAFWKIEKYEVILLQETVLRVEKTYKIMVYTTYMTPQEDSDRGQVIMVTSFILIKRISNPISCGTKVKVMAVMLTM